MAAAASLPPLIVGDVHGDLERLFSALRPYPATEWRTVFLGDLVDGGPFGVGALRYARDRPNSTVLLGNHEVAMLWALRDRSRIGFWVGIGGQPHDLQELERDPPLQAWLRRMGARRVVHGHSRHRARQPEAYHGGKAICYDGGLSRYYSGYPRRGRGAAGATVAPLPD